MSWKEKCVDHLTAARGLLASVWNVKRLINLQVGVYSQSFLHADNYMTLYLAS